LRNTLPGAPPLVDIGGIINEDSATSSSAAARRPPASDTASDAPQPVPSGAKKIAIGSQPASVARGSAAPVGKGVAAAADVRAKSPASTFLTGVGWGEDDDDTAKVSGVCTHSSCVASDSCVMR
jgi:hypothetical protein